MDEDETRLEGHDEAVILFVCPGHVGGRGGLGGSWMEEGREG